MEMNNGMKGVCRTCKDFCIARKICTRKDRRQNPTVDDCFVDWCMAWRPAEFECTNCLYFDDITLQGGDWHCTYSKQENVNYPEIKNFLSKCKHHVLAGVLSNRHKVKRQHKRSVELKSTSDQSQLVKLLLRGKSKELERLLEEIEE